MNTHPIVAAVSLHYFCSVIKNPVSGQRIRQPLYPCRPRFLFATLNVNESFFLPPLSLSFSLCILSILVLSILSCIQNVPRRHARCSCLQPRLLDPGCPLGIAKTGCSTTRNQFVRVSPPLSSILHRTFRSAFPRTEPRTLCGLGDRNKNGAHGVWKVDVVRYMAFSLFRELLL